MNKNRAEEIINSNEVIEVLYNGSSVWLEEIKGDIAEVTDISNKKKIEVNVNELKEV